MVIGDLRGGVTGAAGGLPGALGLQQTSILRELEVSSATDVMSVPLRRGYEEASCDREMRNEEKL
jgi:hypothetical protein